MTVAKYKIVILIVVLALTACANIPEDTGQITNVTTSAHEALARGDHFLRQGMLDKARYFYTLALRHSPDNTEALVRIAYLYELRHDLLSAARAYDEVLTLDATHAGALERRGTLLLKNREYEMASRLLKRAIDADPRRVKAHNGLGVIADLERDHKRAIAHYSEALEVAPESVQTLINLGYSHYLAGTWQNATVYFNHALKLDPDNLFARQNIGLLKARQGYYSEAIEHMTHVISEAQAHNDIGYACMLDKKHEVAAEFFNEAIRLSPSYYAAAHKNLTLNRKLSALAVVPVNVVAPAHTNVDFGEKAKSDRPVATHASKSDSKPDRTVATHASKSDRTVATHASLNLRRWVNTPILRVRQQAGINSEVLDRLKRGRVVRIIQQQQDWVLVKYWLYNDGVVSEKTGWVSIEFLSDERRHRQS